MWLIIFQYLSHCVVGASLEEPEEEDDDAHSTSNSIAPHKEGCYEIVGTMKAKGETAEKPEYVKEIVNVRICPVSY